VFSSTGGAIYGDGAVVPMPDDAPQRPLAPYGQGTAGAQATSVLELAALLAVAVEHRPGRAGEVRHSCLDRARARRELGWETPGRA
jgi:nucleoside-diphosphate-sugar epimerase